MRHASLQPSLTFYYSSPPRNRGACSIAEPLFPNGCPKSSMPNFFCRLFHIKHITYPNIISDLPISCDDNSLEERPASNRSRHMPTRSSNLFPISPRGLGQIAHSQVPGLPWSQGKAHQRGENGRSFGFEVQTEGRPVRWPKCQGK